MTIDLFFPSYQSFKHILLMILSDIFVFYYSHVKQIYLVSLFWDLGPDGLFEVKHEHH